MDSVCVTGRGLTRGPVIAAVRSVTLGDVLTGVFDPPPDLLTIPWGYLVGVTVAVVGPVVAAGLITLQIGRAPVVTQVTPIPRMPASA